eukprot:7963831-Pyramimonas_sp.AAC.1
MSFSILPNQSLHRRGPSGFVWLGSVCRRYSPHARVPWWEPQCPGAPVPGRARGCPGARGCPLAL